MQRHWSQVFPLAPCVRCGLCVSRAASGVEVLTSSHAQDSSDPGWTVSVCGI